ncbi:unnamed protein product [Dicrocoelium dendriticum]|nr:unnamed protein product [Dicrocoelium dendriticum]
MARLLNSLVKFQYPVLSPTCKRDTYANTCIHRYYWKTDQDGQVPKHALVAGISKYKEPLYVVRACIDGQFIVGKVVEGGDCAYFPFRDSELSRNVYEVLVWNKKA